MGSLIRKVNQMQNYPSEFHAFPSSSIMIWELPAVLDPDTANSPLLLEIIVFMSLYTNVQSMSRFFWEPLVSMLTWYLENSSICGCAWTNNTARHEGYQAFDGVWVICVPSWFLKVHILYPQNVSSNISYWNLLSYLLGAQIVEGDSWHFCIFPFFTGKF